MTLGIIVKNQVSKNYQGNAKLCYTYTGSFIVYLETKDVLSSPCKRC